MTNAPTLYVVATPIGNLEDMTFRAVQVLKTVDWIAAEDTRRTGILLHHFQIKTPQISYHEHNCQQRIPELLNRLQGGASIALVTDAGVPSISDPGWELVNACFLANLPVTPIPGANAAITALSVAGLATDRFAFEGFLPPKPTARRSFLQTLEAETRTLIFYEAPHRLRATLADMVEIWGGARTIAIARELTKRHEELWRGSLASAVSRYQTQEPQGEFTLVLAGATLTPVVLSEASLKAELIHLLQQGLSRSQASRQLARATTLPRQHLYQLALTLADPEIRPSRDP
jgi:16S rRNA (cytidine1402-2'-O)-methyltransferase